MSQQRRWRVLGVDPGLAALGWGVVETDGQRHQCVEYGTIRTNPDQSSGERLSAIVDGIADVIRRREPTQGALETLYFVRNVSSALPVAEARGVCLLQMYRSGLSPIGEYTPMAIKQALVGNGHAGKKQVQEMVRFMLQLTKLPKPDHAADALAAAITHIHTAVVPVPGG